MALQGLDLTIAHHSGKHNSNADALSHWPLPSFTDNSPTPQVVNGVTRSEDEPAAEGELRTLQKGDEELSPIIDFLTSGTLPEEGKLARTIALTSLQYTLLDGVLYRVKADSTLRVIPPRIRREEFFSGVHGKRFGAHLSDVKVYSELRKHYWWTGMRRDVTLWTRACLTCATHQPG